MAAGTYTASEAYALKSLHAGLNVVRSRWAYGDPTGSGSQVSLSTSDIVFMARIPNKAVVVDGYLAGGNTGMTTGVWKLGLRPASGTAGAAVNTVEGYSLSDDALIAAASTTAGNIVRFSAFRSPFTVSISDDAAQQWCWVVATYAAGSATATGSLNLVLQYLANSGS